MRKRRLGRTDLELTTIGLGTWAMGGTNWRFGWGPQDDDEAVAALVRGVELGANWIDTAAVYGQGHAEELVGRALARLPAADRPLIATKCGRRVRADGSVYGDLTCERVLAECEASLRRLGADVIDLYQLHWPDPDAQIEEGFRAAVALQEQGKVRHVGVSNFDVAQLERVAATGAVASLQPPYSMIDRRFEEAALAYCGTREIGVVAYSPMAKGLLTGAFTAERAAALTGDDHRSRDPEFQGGRLAANLELVQGLGAIAARHGRTPAELAIAWVLRHDAVTSAIVGVRRPDQIEGTAGAADWTLDAATCAEIETLLEARD